MMQFVKRIIPITLVTFMISICSSVSLKAQIWEPEGLNLPGLWNGWTNPPANALALASYTQVPGGLVTKINTGTARWHTTIKVAATGGDVVGGSYPFLFTSGPAASPWQNTWKDVTVVMNTLQDYTYNGIADNQITVVDGKWYTVNWKDNGYASSKAIFMETSANPVSITSVTQFPIAGQVPVGQDVTVTVALSGAPCLQELFYIRYSNNGFSTSNLIPILISGTSGSATIPATTGTVSYYVFSTTVSNPGSDFDLFAIKVDNNGGSNYSYYYNTTNYNVTFRVDMSLQTVSPDGVHLVGDFQGWNSTTSPMTNTGGGVYSITIPLPGSSYHEYKYLNGNSFAGEEIVPSSCGADNGSGGYNRFLTIPENDTLLGNICFSACSACSSFIPVTFVVDMTQQTVSLDGVHLAGDFQGWNPNLTPMSTSGNGIYSATVSLPSGSYHEYKFINGNAWTGEEIVPADCGADNGSGGVNRFLTVGSVSSTTPLVCFSSCDPCAFPVPVTFEVDMTQQLVSPDGVHLVGDFQGWDPNLNMMILGTNGIYSTTVTLPSGSYQEYKFINGMSWYGEETVPSECGTDNGNGGFNRFLTVGSSASTVPAVCFSSCEACLPPPQEINVTFKVNMSEEVVSPDGIHLVGDFQDWDIDSLQMTGMGNNIYTITIPLFENSYHEFKFVNGLVWEGAELVPAECGIDDGNGGFNRFLTLPANDTILEAVCFSSCEPCPSPPATSVVTFLVDLRDQVVSSAGVHLAGNFQGWDPSATPMTLVGDGIYEASLLLDEDSIVQYKYINGITFADAELVPADCGIDDGNGGYNRLLSVPLNDTTTDAVCFSQCSICHVGLNELAEGGIIIGKPWPNPANREFSIHFSSSEPLIVKIRIFSMMGIEVISDKLFSIPAGDRTVKMDIGQLTPGIYFVSLVINQKGKEFMVSRSLISR